MRLEREFEGIQGSKFPVKELDALIDGIADGLDKPEGTVKTYYCFITRKKKGRKKGRKEGKKQGRKELQVGGRNSGSKYGAK